MTEEQKATLEAVLRTLDRITVCGMENLDKMLGCMQALHSLAQSQPAQAGGADHTAE